jgi:hypothetical protein
LDDEFLFNNMGYIKWYVMVNKGWKPNDPMVEKMSFEQWSIYYLIMKRQETINYNRERQLFELSSVIINPQTFGEYYKKTYGKDEQQKSMEMEMDELGMEMVFKDKDTNTTLTQTEMLNIIKKIPGFMHQKSNEEEE